MTERMSLKDAYIEWLNCGNKGTIVEYALKIGFKLEVYEDEEKEEKKDDNP